MKKEELGEFANGNLNRLLHAMDNTVNFQKFAKKAKTYVAYNHVLNAEKIKDINELFIELLK